MLFLSVVRCEVALSAVPTKLLKKTKTNEARFDANNEKGNDQTRSFMTKKKLQSSLVEH